MIPSLQAASPGATVLGRTAAGGKVGESVPRPDGAPKTSGSFMFSSDLWSDGMLWGQTLRSPHARARILDVDVSEALRIDGVRAVLTHEDVPGSGCYGLDRPDQPVLAKDVVRYCGEPIVVLAADHPETARRAADAIRVSYEPLHACCDPEEALHAPPLHPDGNVIRTLAIRSGDLDAEGEVQVEGSYEVGMQDQAFMGTESGMALPSGDGGVELFISTQWLHADLEQITAALDLP